MRKLLLISIVLIAVGLGLMLYSDPIIRLAGNSGHPTGGSLPPGCTRQSNGVVSCGNTSSSGNSTGLTQTRVGSLNSDSTTETIVGVALIGLGLILVAVEALSSGPVASHAKTVT